MSIFHNPVLDSVTALISRLIFFLLICVKIITLYKTIPLIEFFKMYLLYFCIETEETASFTADHTIKFSVSNNDYLKNPSWNSARLGRFWIGKLGQWPLKKVKIPAKFQWFQREIILKYLLTNVKTLSCRSNRLWFPIPKVLWDIQIKSIPTMQHFHYILRKIVLKY